MPGKEPVYHVICTPHQPVTTHFRCDSIEMVNPRGLSIASGFVVFDCVFVVKSHQTRGILQTPERASGE